MSIEISGVDIVNAINGDRVSISHKTFRFPSGEMGVDLVTAPESCAIGDIRISGKICTPDEIFELFLTLDVLKNKYKNSKIHLDIPYIPFGRQDRHTTNESSFSLKVFALLLNTFNIDKITTLTPHSNVSELLINNLEINEPTESFKLCVTSFPKSETIIIAPDAGAEKRAYLMAEAAGIKDVYVCSKRRNAVTGKIHGMVAPIIPNNKHMIVVDDLVDGGRTFIELAKVLPTDRKSLTLFVSHGIFSKGRDVLNMYDNIHACNTFIEERLKETNDSK